MNDVCIVQKAQRRAQLSSYDFSVSLICVGDEYLYTGWDKHELTNFSKMTNPLPQSATGSKLHHKVWKGVKLRRSQMVTRMDAQTLSFSTIALSSLMICG